MFLDCMPLPSHPRCLACLQEPPKLKCPLDAPCPLPKHALARAVAQAADQAKRERWCTRDEPSQRCQQPLARYADQTGRCVVRVANTIRTIRISVIQCALSATVTSFLKRSNGKVRGCYSLVVLVVDGGGWCGNVVVVAVVVVVVLEAVCGGKSQRTRRRLCWIGTSPCTHSSSLLAQSGVPPSLPAVVSPTPLSLALALCLSLSTDAAHTGKRSKIAHTHTPYPSADHTQHPHGSGQSEQVHGHDSSAGSANFGTRDSSAVHATRLSSHTDTPPSTDGIVAIPTQRSGNPASTRLILPHSSLNDSKPPFEAVNCQPEIQRYLSTCRVRNASLHDTNLSCKADCDAVATRIMAIANGGNIA